MTGSASVLDVRGVRVLRPDGRPIVDGVDVRLEAGEILGLVGESGAGKTTTLLALLGHRAPRLTYSFDAFEVDGRPAQQGRRGSRHAAAMALVPQNPGRSLNPSMRIGQIVADSMRGRGRSERSVADYLDIVGLGEVRDVERRYPHQLSGGQQQRVCIAAALAVQPRVIVLDEPTTGLDVVTQSRILAELERLRRDENVAMLYVTHDLSVVAQIADRLAVLYAGRIVEQGATASMLSQPQHPYTRGLLDATPDHLHPAQLKAMAGVSAAASAWGAGCAFGPRCSRRTPSCDAAPELVLIQSDDRQVRCVHPIGALATPRITLAPSARERAGLGVPLVMSGVSAAHETRHGRVTAVRDVDLDVQPGECVALLGESGSGKSTTARVIAGLHPPVTGRVSLGGVELAPRVSKRSPEQRRSIQLVYQNAADALNPSHTALTSVRRAVEIFQGLSRREAAGAAAAALETVGLPARVAGRLPGELSGGERQRVAIARALAAKPAVLVCDEITSSLDVSVQASIWELLAGLRGELGLSLLVVTHDLGVVADIADRAVVLRRGEIVEAGQVVELLAAPQHSYTAELLAAAPSLSKAVSDQSASGEPRDGSVA